MRLNRGPGRELMDDQEHWRNWRIRKANRENALYNEKKKWQEEY